MSVGEFVWLDSGFAFQMGHSWTLMLKLPEEVEALQQMLPL